MKKINLLLLIGVLLILAACSKERTVQDEENQTEVDPIESTYKDEAISISISTESERYDQGETPVVIIRNHGETPVDYTGLRTSLEYLQDNVWIAADDAVTEDKLNVLEPGNKMEQKFPSSSIQQKGVYRIVFKFNEIGDRSSENQRVAVLFSVN